ncbi:unnamed protein product [Rotaria sp. Silwood2]|nr:unnamed protein product [Rotaria sp. Silwood2]CAF3331249.1 unnamed protein product [Rotaria sp. Silwood2]CAF4448327.1 unnamed protein product [Rotaria sp. Silwood2]
MTTIENQTDDTFFDLTKKKKSKNRTSRGTRTEQPATANSTNNVAEDETKNDTTGDNSDYTYDYLINRAFEAIYESKPSTTEQTKCTLMLPPIQVGRIGTRRTAFVNFALICKLVHRQEKQLHEYFIVELGTTASIDKNHALIIKGRFQQTHIENVLRSFIKEYVFCKSCRSPDTLLGKSDRLTVIKCNTCHSQYTVASIRKKC